MRLLLTNEKGLFNKLALAPVCTLNAVKNIESWAQGTLEGAPELKEEERQKLKDFLALVQQLPVKDIWCSKLGDYDFGTQKKTDSWGHVPSYGFYNLGGNFVGRRVVIESEYGISDIYSQWDVVFKTLQIKGLPSILKKIYFSQPDFSAFKRFHQKHSSFNIQEEDLSQALSQATSFAVYQAGQVNSRRGGFLNAEGRRVQSLASARMFESAVAAKNTIGSRKLSGAVVVEIESYLTRLVPVEGLSSTQDIGELRFGLSTAEKKSLTESLNEMEIESQLQELQKVKQEHPEWFTKETVSAPKRRI